MEIKMLAPYILFWLSLVMNVVHLLVRIKNERVQKVSSSWREKEFWSLFQTRTLIGAMVTLIATMLVMAI